MTVYEKSARFLHQPVGGGPRALLALAAVLLAVAVFLPLWNLTMFAPQYSHGLRLDIFSYTLVGGNSGHDVNEINLLNHYIGMHALSVDDFTEFKWMPFAFGVLALIFLRAIVLGTVKELTDSVMVFVYFGLFSLWSFGYKLYRYGHDLSPEAPVKVAPFSPPVFGYQKIANFEVYSYPKAGTYILIGVAAALFGAVWLAWRQRNRRTA
jgi:hypothetical protein